MILTIKGTHEQRFSLAGPETMATLFLNSDFNIMAMGSYMKEVEHSRATVLAAACSLLDAMVADAELFGFRYQIVGRMPVGVEEVPFCGSGGVSGFHIDGHPCSIRGGMGRCTLKEMAVGEDGRGHIVRAIDVRHLKELRTDDWGVIKIQRKKVTVKADPMLRDMINFMNNLPDENVRKVLLDRDYTVMDLVRMVREHPEAKDGAEEQLFNRGIAARDELTGLLTDKKKRKYYGTMAWLLLTVFRSPEAEQTVRALRESVNDMELKAHLGLLLGADAR
jgi:hypothetical protein